MNFLDILYHHLVDSATTGSAVRFPVIVKIVMPDRIGTAQWHIPGGALQTADFIIPGYTVTIEVGVYRSLHTIAHTMAHPQCY